MENKNIRIEFLDDWLVNDNEIDKEIYDFLKNGINYIYNKNTTLKDLLTYFTNNIKHFWNRYENWNIEDEYSEISLKRNFLYVYNNIPTYIYNINIKLEDFINILNIKEKLIFKENFIDYGGCGDIWLIDGIRYYMNSKENSKHNTPHIHVQYRNKEVSISILDGSVLAGGIKNNIQREAIERIMSHQKELALAWNTKTDGKDIDIDEMNFTLGG